MSHVDNSQRARDIIAGIEQRLGDVLSGAAERIQRALDEAEDLGGERVAQLPAADADTVEALRGMVREMLEPLVENPWTVTDRANAITQVIVANFRIRLMDETDCEAPGNEKTDPINAARKS